MVQNVPLYASLITIVIVCKKSAAALTSLFFHYYFKIMEFSSLCTGMKLGLFS
jgi:hypothetical protein